MDIGLMVRNAMIIILLTTMGDLVMDKILILDGSEQEAHLYLEIIDSNDLVATIQITIKSFVYIGEVMAIELLRSDVMTIILIVVMGVIMSERLKHHGNDMEAILRNKIHEHTETRPSDGILIMAQPDGTLLTILNCGSHKI